jgi:succinate dehydrogenase / fumarate reductase, membrane anchor subunit
VVNRIVVGAHYGLRGWLVQRISAIFMAAYIVIFFLAMLAVRPSGFAAWKGLMSQGWMRTATFLFFVSLILHAWVGMRDILMDYIKPTGLRLGMEVGVILVLAVYGAWTVQILWR